MSPVKAVVFGATGAVGSSAAYTAKEHGANVFLAVRDLTKPLPNSTLEQEKRDGFTRVQADLTKPDTLRAAVAATRATTAFVYLAFEAPDGMKASFEALKGAGVDFVVFLSSSAVRGDPRDATPDNFTGWAHGQAEILLERTLGRGGYVALRPGFFASNTLWWRDMVRDGHVRLPYPRARNDAISPADIGRVAGAVLASGPSVLDGLEGKHNAILLYGPRLVAQEDQVAAIARALGREIRVTTVGEEGYVQVVAKVIPEPLARDVVAEFRIRAGLGEDDGFYAEPVFGEASENIEKYSGKPPTQFEEWAVENKGLYE